MVDPTAIISISLTAIFGISAWVYAQVNLREVKRQSKIALERVNQKLEVSQTEIYELKNGIPNDIETSENVHESLLRLNDIIKNQGQKNKKVSIKIFGLDLQTVMPWFMTKIIHDDFYNDIYIDFKCMLINPDLNIIRPLINGHSDISKDAIHNSIKNALAIGDIPNIDRLTFEMRQYSLLPIVHGFMVDDEFIGIAFTEIENKKLYGGIYQYIHGTKNAESRFMKHLFGIFSSWFDFYWGNSKLITLINK